MQCENKYHKVGVEILDQIIENFKAYVTNAFIIYKEECNENLSVTTFRLRFLDTLLATTIFVK